MAEKIKLTKNELQKQQRELKKFQRFLPTLQLKKQQLQLEVRKVQDLVEEKEAELARLKKETIAWTVLFSDYHEQDWLNSVKIQQTYTSDANIAGVKVKMFEDIDFEEKDYSLFATPVWLDAAFVRIREMLTLREQTRILNDTKEALQREARKTNQRVNLFEKVVIPRAQTNIRVINIYLGDQDRNAVARSKIAKKKLLAK
jgi:V/A-type H+-transporting ATPase subunit D